MEKEAGGVEWMGEASPGVVSESLLGTRWGWGFFPYILLDFIFTLFLPCE